MTGVLSVDYKKSGRMYFACLYLGLALVVASIFARAIWVTLAGGLVLIFGALQAYLFCKCPKCGKRISLKKGKPGFCSECDTELEF